jgi:hypothetical protein
MNSHHPVLEVEPLSGGDQFGRVPLHVSRGIDKTDGREKAVKKWNLIMRAKADEHIVRIKLKRSINIGIAPLALPAEINSSVRWNAAPRWAKLASEDRYQRKKPAAARESMSISLQSAATTFSLPPVSLLI